MRRMTYSVRTIACSAIFVVVLAIGVKAQNTTEFGGQDGGASPSVLPVPGSANAPAPTAPSPLIKPAEPPVLDPQSIPGISAGAIDSTTPSLPLWISAVVQIVTPLAWPLTVVVLALLLSFNTRLARLFGISAKIVRKIKAGGLEMEISTEAVDRVRSHLRESFDELMANARREYDRMAEFWNLYQNLGRIMTVTVPQVLGENGMGKPLQGSRATIHIQDIVFPDYLYQLVDYYPKRTNAAGRRFSQRYGIIGRSWRLEKSLGEGNAMSAAGAAEQTLIEQWGMTRQEAQAPTHARPACLSVVLRNRDEGGFPIGILFIDSDLIDMFGDNRTASKVALALEETHEIQLLEKNLARVLTPLRLAAPNINISGS